MKEGYRFLGEYIRQVDIRNKEGKKENLLGVSVQKQFIQSIANTVGTDFTKYKIVKKGQFTYIPDTSRRGDKIAIALLEDYEEGLVSNVYTVFEVIDTEKLLPEYLMLWFSRPEFDRYARFKSHGSVREVMDWEEMCKVELPVPDIEKQRKIVKAYKTITDRIALKQKINDNLVSTLQIIYKKMFLESQNTYITKPLADLCSKIGSGANFVAQIKSADSDSVIYVSTYGYEITNSKGEKSTYADALWIDTVLPISQIERYIEKSGVAEPSNISFVGDSDECGNYKVWIIAQEENNPHIIELTDRKKIDHMIILYWD